MTNPEVALRYIEKERVWRIEAHDEDHSPLGGMYFKKNSSNTLKLLYIYVHIKQRNIGELLLNRLITFAQENNYCEIIGDFQPVPEYAQAAEHLYTSNGFVLNQQKHTIRLELPH